MVKYVKSDLQFTPPETHVHFYSVKLESPILTYFTMFYLFNHFIVQYSPLCITYIEPFVPVRHKFHIMIVIMIMIVIAIMIMIIFVIMFVIEIILHIMSVRRKYFTAQINIFGKVQRLFCIYS